MLLHNIVYKIDASGQFDGFDYLRAHLYPDSSFHLDKPKKNQLKKNPPHLRLLNRRLVYVDAHFERENDAVFKIQKVTD